MAGKASIENGKKGGRPKGAKSQATLEKEAVLRVFRQKVMESADVLFQSQLALARGYTYLYKIEKERIEGPKGGVSYRAKKPALVTATWEIEAYLMGLIDEEEIDKGPEATYYFMVTKDPNNMAADSMLDRTFGKSTNVTELINPDGNLKTVIINKYGSHDKPAS